MGNNQDSSKAMKLSAEEKSSFASKDGDLPLFYTKSERKKFPRRLLYGLAVTLLFVGIFFIKPSLSIINVQFNSPSSLTTKPGLSSGHTRNEKCPQVDPLSPRQTTRALKKMDRCLSSYDYADFSADLLSKAVTFRTISYDDMSDPDFPLDDPLYKPFGQFERFIRREFPYLSRVLKFERINEHGLLYTWKGSDSDLKPTLLLAHQDVVPVDDASLDEWTEPPWDGSNDNGFIWGRGSFDDKHSLIAILEAVEALLDADFEPRRTLLLSLGFDQENGGLKGGSQLAEHISSRYEEGAAVIIDEGSGGFLLWGGEMIGIGVTEKTHVPLDIEIRTPGGQASQPVPHTGVGIMSQIVEEIERLEYHTYLSEDHPLLGFLTCAQEHTESFPSHLEPLLIDRLAGNIPPINEDKLAIEFVEQSPNYLQSDILWGLTTAKSVNAICGGVKANSLPEYVTAKTDIRIHIAETTQSIKDDISGIVGAVSRDHNLTFIDFDEIDPETPEWSIRVSAGGLDQHTKISPSKIEPWNDTPWSILAGTTRNILGSDLIVSPGISTGDTDAKWYSNISDYIYRYSPGAILEDSANINTANEAMSIERHVDGVRWYSNFIRNMDEAKFDFE
ncbi:MAG: hypothetical protein LQ342_008090 [Letrouitia transgressa]|nr:MAG: hypothetical protein LQ342_008090 [Letrouitia transgressa]